MDVTSMRAQWSTSQVVGVTWAGEGTGLGLSIVGSVSRVHGGEVSAQARPARDGGGLAVVVLRLPTV